MKLFTASIAALAVFSALTTETLGDMFSELPPQNGSETEGQNNTAATQRPRIVHLTKRKDAVSTTEDENGNRVHQVYHSEVNDTNTVVLAESVANNTNEVPKETFGITFINKEVGISTTSQRMAGVGYALTQVAYNTIYNDGKHKYDSSRFKSTHRFANGVKVVLKGKGIDYFNGTTGGLSISKVIPPVEVIVEPVDPALGNAGANFTAKNVAEQLTLATDHVFDFNERGSPSVVIKDSQVDLMTAAHEIADVMAQGPGAIDIQVFGDYKPDSDITDAMTAQENRTQRLNELGSLILQVSGAHNPTTTITPSP